MEISCVCVCISIYIYIWYVCNDYIHWYNTNSKRVYLCRYLPNFTIIFWYRYGTGPSKESCFKPTKIGQGNFNDILIDVTKGNIVRVDSNSWKSAGNRFAPQKTGLFDWEKRQKGCVEPVEPFTLWEQLQSWTPKIGAPSTVVLVVLVLVAGDELPGNRCWISPLFPEKKNKQDTQPSDHPLETLHMIQSGTSPLPHLKRLMFHPYYQKYVASSVSSPFNPPKTKCVK